MPIRPLSKELQEIAEKELNEVPSRIQTDLDHIREWISQQPHLKARTDDQWLIAFLRASKFSLQRTKKKIDLFYTVRSLNPEFSNRDPLSPEIQEVLRRGVIFPLPKTADATAHRILLSRFSILDPEKISLINYVKVIQMVVEVLMLEDDNFVVCGTSAIWDYKNFPYRYVSQFTPRFLKQMKLLSQDSYPIRVKSMECFNSPSAFVTVYNSMKVLFSEKFRSRLFWHSGDKIVNTKYVPIWLLPKEYGGDEVPCDEIAAYWKIKLESYRDWFLEDTQYGVDETKRPGKPKTVDETFGVESSFMKLEID